MSRSYKWLIDRLGFDTKAYRAIMREEKTGKGTQDTLQIS